MNNLLPMSMRVAAQTIGQDLVSVVPMKERYDIKEYYRLKKIDERKMKIDKIIERMKKGD